MALDKRFREMPNDIFWNHVLPHCSIDVRLAFRCAPRKLEIDGEFANRLNMLQKCRRVWVKDEMYSSWAWRHCMCYLIPLVPMTWTREDDIPSRPVPCYNIFWSYKHRESMLSDAYDDMEEWYVDVQRIYIDFTLVDRFRMHPDGMTQRF
jgi:hypothetical protein